jgi:SAM-dependent methyltransferase
VPEDLDGALQQLRPLLLDPDVLVRAVAAGRRRSATPPWRRVELRPIDLKDGRHLQVVAYDERQATTTNTAYGDQAGAEIDALLAQPFGNWHVRTTTETLQLRVTKKGLAQLHRKAEAGEQHTGHDRAARHLIDPGDPLFRVLGAGASKRRQVDAFLRVLQAAVAEADLPTGRPLRVVDLGCGNAYLSFAAYRFLAADRQVQLTGIDQRPEMRERNSALAAELGWSDAMTFVAGDIIEAPASEDDSGDSVDVVLALHACDTATDDALAQAVRWAAPVVLASPCCHHDLQRQMSAGGAPPPYGLVTRHNILRERLGDVLTDAVRAALLRRVGYRVEVVQFVSAEYTPRNTMIRAVRTGAAQPDSRADAEYEALVADWGVTPHLQTLLADDLAARR